MKDFLPKNVDFVKNAKYVGSEYPVVYDEE